MHPLDRDNMADDPSDAASSLPDQYGHGFARTENPLERTVEKWQHQEKLRMRFGRVARHPLSMFVRLLFGASVAAVALLSVILPSVAPPNPGYVMLFWLLPLIVTTIPPLFAGEAMWQSIQARISLREIDDETTGGKLSLRSQPGMDRILEGLIDVRAQHRQ